jgi:hypothetical protein
MCIINSLTSFGRRSLVFFCLRLVKPFGFFGGITLFIWKWINLKAKLLQWFEMVFDSIYRNYIATSLLRSLKMLSWKSSQNLVVNIFATEVVKKTTNAVVLFQLLSSRFRAFKISFVEILPFLLNFLSTATSWKRRQHLFF